MMIGIDKPIDQLIASFTKYLWPSNDCDYKGRIYDNELDGGLSPDEYNKEGKYIERLLNDNKDATIFFRITDIDSENLMADVEIYASINLEKIYPTLTNRADEKAAIEIQERIFNSPFHIKKTVKGKDAFSAYKQSLQNKYDMHPYCLLRFDTDVSFDMISETITEPTTVTATITSGTGGTTDPASGVYTRSLNENNGYYAIADAGYKFSQWIKDGIVRLTNPIAVLAESNYTLVAQFIAQWTLTTSVDGEGTITPESGTYDDGDVVTITATPTDPETTELDRIEVNGVEVSTTSPYSLLMDKVNSVVGYFKSLLIPLTRNTDIVEAGCYTNLSSSALPYDAINFSTGRTFFPKNNILTIRQSGLISKINFRMRPGFDISEMYFQVWRKNGSGYDLVHTTTNISSQLVVYNNEIEIEIPNVKPGDIIAAKGVTASGTSGMEVATGKLSGSLLYGDTSIVTDPFNFDSNFSALGWYLTIKSYQQAPLLVGIGDSIVAGHPANYSGSENSFINVPENCITGQLELIDTKYVSQNLGIGGQTTNQIKARFDADVLPKKPKIVIINGGINDISFGSETDQDYIDNFTYMLDSCIANDIIPVVCAITPWTGGTNEQMQIRDRRTALLVTLLESYATAIYCNFDESLGQFRTGGDVGNLWDYKTTHTADNVHPNLVGYASMASVINTAIKLIYTLQ